MVQHRRRRVGDQLRVEIADLVLREIKDPKLGFVTITEVRMSPDLQSARVFFSVLGGEEAESESLEALRRATGFLRSCIGRRMRLRHVPRLVFDVDQTLDFAARIEELLEGDDER